MSYCRFSEGDVYAYECVGGVQFYAAVGRRELDRLCSTFDEAYQYAKELRDTHGLDVPSHAIEALKADALEEAARICGSNGAVAELEAENEKLRDENARLRSCLSDDADNARQIMGENAELRELVADMWRFTGAACKKYPRLFDQSAQGPQVVLPNALDFYEQRMRELGVEMD